MKDSISIIFAAIIGTLLIVILPLYSILDRQDSMSYNVVLTATTNFVDNIRNNGFIDNDSYNKYMSKLATTSNTYKVSLEVYKNVLIKDTDENGNVIEGSYVEVKELYNTQDILQQIAVENIDGAAESNIKNSAYLLNENDEIYIRIHNTNVTSGSILYSLLADTTNSQVINISYGGVVNNVNWELYDKINAEVTKAPEVLISVPINLEGNTNIQKVENVEEDNIVNFACPSIDIQDLSGSTTVDDLCGDLNEQEQYVYLYDLTDVSNKTITVAVELRRFAKIDIGENGSDGETYIDISELETKWSDKVGKYILSNYVKVDGFGANKSIKLREDGDYYVFEITFSDVKMSQIDYISNKAKIVILPGLGIDKYGTASLIAESVEIELTDSDADIINNVTISQPINWKKLLKTKSLAESIILSNEVYANQEIAFIISYTGIKNEQEEDEYARDERILQAIKDNLKIYKEDAAKSKLEYYTVADLKKEHDIDISTASAGHVVVKFSYDSANESEDNYLKLPDGWIETNIDYETEGLEILTDSVGAQSIRYKVLLDDEKPYLPTIAISGTLGNNGWYRSNVTVNLLESKGDKVQKNGGLQTGGSGVYKNTLYISGAVNVPEQEINTYEISTNGISNAIGRAYDCSENFAKTETVTIKIDKELPTEPEIKLEGEKSDNGWYTNNVTVKITPGTDNVSEVYRTTYKITGANAVDEKTYTKSFKITKSGTSTIIATTYDNAGNKSEKKITVNMDTSTPPDVTIKVIDGKKINDCYFTDVKLNVKLQSDGSGVSSYEVIGESGETEVALTSFEEDTTEINLSSTGKHTVNVYTYTKAGSLKKTTHEVKIDQAPPNLPTIDISGTAGENGWYKPVVKVKVSSNGDVGPAGEATMTYKIIDKMTNYTIVGDTEITDEGVIELSEEGQYTLEVTAKDKVLNSVTTSNDIKIDESPPTSAKFVINGTIINSTKDIRKWYNSNVELRAEGGSDSISGIQSVTLSTKEIKQNTQATIVTLTTKDNAGNSVVENITIKIDKSAPNEPEIELTEKPTGTGISGVNLYNKNVTVKITPGEDNFISGIDNLKENKVEISKDGKIITSESIQSIKTYDLSGEGKYIVTATAVDKAGNKATASKIIWIDESKPTKPKIVSINGTHIGDMLNKDIKGDANILSLGVDNLTERNDVKITLINQETSKKITINQIAPANGMINIELLEKGKYSIKITQTNMYGTISDESEGLYYYIYK